MKRALSTAALACALTLTPACSTLHLGQAQIENPVAAAETLDQQAYALLHSYAAIVEEATDIVSDPDTPAGFSRALAQTEAVATPAVETLQIAVASYLRARADFEAATGEDTPALERAATALAIAAQRLSEAIAAAEAPIGEIEDLVRARRG